MASRGLIPHRSEKMPTAKPTNPFYVVLLIAGLVFVITACSYFVMTLQGREASYGRGSESQDAAFVEFIDRHGFTLLMIELGILAAATFGAMATDDYWTRLAKEGENEDDGAKSEDESDPQEIDDESESSRTS